jgi:hypothetical protein
MEGVRARTAPARGRGVCRSGSKPPDPKETAMRIRVLPVLLLLLFTGLFALLNWPAFATTTTLSLGFTTVQASPALVMLVLVALLGMAYVASVVYLQGVALLESRRLGKELQTQRELADKAEASRFTELREFMTSELQRVVQASAESRASLLQRMEQLEQRQRLALEETGNSLSAYIGELEDRLEHHVPPQGAPSLAPRGPDRGRTF